MQILKGSAIAMQPLLHKLLASRRMEYFKLDRSLTILEASPGVNRFINNKELMIPGTDIRLSLPELFGIESILIEVLDGIQESFLLEGITRNLDENSAQIYLDLQAIGDLNTTTGKPQLWLLIQEATQRWNLEKSLVQSTNEMQLLISQLSASEAYINQLVAAMADGLLVTTQSGIIESANRAIQTLLEYSEADLVGSSIKQLIADRNFILQTLQPDCTASPDCSEIDDCWRDVEVVCWTKSGRRRTLSFSCSMLQTGLGRSPRFIYVCRDITERVQTQQRMMVEYSVTRSLSESYTLQQATFKAIQLICSGLDWVFGQLWLADASTTGTDGIKVLECLETWSRSPQETASFATKVEQLMMRPGDGCLGRVWVNKLPEWIVNTEEAASQMHCSYLLFAAQTGLSGAVCIPVQQGEEVLGILILLSRTAKQPSSGLLQTLTVLGNQLGLFIQRQRAEMALHQSQQQTEHLLLNILPSPIADRLKQMESALQPTTTTIAEHFTEATVLFADIVGFTEIAAGLPPIELVALLNQIFSRFDRLSEQYGLEKIKTIGDAYMVVGGVPNKRSDHAEAVAEMALEMQATIAQFNAENQQNLSIRIGIHSGPVVAGVIGIKKFSYDLWGDTVNVASRMESHGSSGQIQVSTATYERLRDRYQLIRRGEVQIKGKGLMATYWLIGKRAMGRSFLDYLRALMK